MQSHFASNIIDFGHCVRIRYRGPSYTLGSRWVVIWEGWPSEGSKAVRRTIPYISDRDKVMREAAGMFMEWLNAGEQLNLRVRKLTACSISSDEWVLIVGTEHVCD